MSGTSSPNSGLTRRSFLKATGAAAGALGLAGAANMIATDTWLAPAQAHAEAGGGSDIRSIIVTVNVTAISNARFVMGVWS